MADQVVMFKRCVREAAIKNGIVRNFYGQTGGRPTRQFHACPSKRHFAHHRQTPVTRVKDGFSSAFASYIGGLQHYLPEISAMLIPNINSFRRINTPWPTVNNHWGVNNRTVGLRVPEISQNSSAMRVENRVSGADANPYLAIAASLLAGFMGMKNKLSLKTDDNRRRLGFGTRHPVNIGRLLNGHAKIQMLRETLGKPLRQFICGLQAHRTGKLPSCCHFVGAKIPPGYINDQLYRVKNRKFFIRR